MLSMIAYDRFKVGVMILLFMLLLNFNVAQAETVIKSNILNTDKALFCLPKLVTLGMTQARLLQVDKSAVPLIRDTGQYSPVLISKSCEDSATSLIYTFSEGDFLLESIAIKKDFESLNNYDSFFSNVASSWGAPEIVIVERQKGEEYPVAVWREDNLTVALTFLSVNSSSSIRFLLVRVADSKAKIKAIVEKVDVPQSVDVAKEMAHINSLLSE